MNGEAVKTEQCGSARRFYIFSKAGFDFEVHECVAKGGSFYDVHTGEQEGEYDILRKKYFSLPYENDVFIYTDSIESMNEKILNYLIKYPTEVYHAYNGMMKLKKEYEKKKEVFAKMIKFVNPRIDNMANDDFVGFYAAMKKGETYFVKVKKTSNGGINYVDLMADITDYVGGDDKINDIIPNIRKDTTYVMITVKPNNETSYQLIRDEDIETFKKEWKELMNAEI